MLRPSVAFLAAFLFALYLSGIVFRLLLSALVATAFSIFVRRYVRERLLQLDPRNRAVFITGTSSGIGKAMVLEAASKGAIVFAGVRQTEHGKNLVELADSKSPPFGKNIIPVIIDVTKQDTIESAHNTVQDELKKRNLQLFAIVNNAGVGVLAPLETVTVEDIHKQFDINVTGVITVTNAFIPLLRESKGRILIIGSVAGRIAVHFNGLYSGTKFAISAIADAYRLELEPWGIGVSLIEPGAFKTEFLNTAKQNLYSITEASSCSDLYSARVKGFENFFETKVLPNAPTADVASRRILLTLFSRFLPTRTLVGIDAETILPLFFLPDVITDFIIKRAF